MILETLIKFSSLYFCPFLRFSYLSLSLASGLLSHSLAPQVSLHRLLARRPVLYCQALSLTQPSGPPCCELCLGPQAPELRASSSCLTGGASTPCCGFLCRGSFSSPAVWDSAEYLQIWQTGEHASYMWNEQRALDSVPGETVFEPHPPPVCDTHVDNSVSLHL